MINFYDRAGKETFGVGDPVTVVRILHAHVTLPCMTLPCVVTRVLTPSGRYRTAGGGPALLIVVREAERSGPSRAAPTSVDRIEYYSPSDAYPATPAATERPGHPAPIQYGGAYEYGAEIVFARRRKVSRSGYLWTMGMDFEGTSAFLLPGHMTYQGNPVSGHLPPDFTRTPPSPRPRASGVITREMFSSLPAAEDISRIMESLNETRFRLGL